MWIREGHEKFYLSVDETKKVKTKNKKNKVFNTKISTNSAFRLKLLSIFHEFLREDRKKTRSLVQKIYEIRCESTKTRKKQFLLANFTAVNTNLGVLDLDSRSSSPFC